MVEKQLIAKDKDGKDVKMTKEEKAKKRMEDIVELVNKRKSLTSQIQRNEISKKDALILYI